MKNQKPHRKFFPVFPVAIVLALLSLALVLLPSPLRSVEANSTYFDLSTGNLTLNLTSGTTNLITSNDNWTAVSSVEGYCGDGLTSTFGVDPQTVLTAEFPSSALPSSSDTCIAANKGNPSAYNAGGLAEFDSGTYLAFGFQGNVQSRAPYMVFYVNTTGRSNIRIAFDVTDIDGGSNNAVSQFAVQYRVGESGNFTNLPAGYIADATDPNVAGRVTSVNILLPPAINNQPQVQIRIITTDAAAPDGTSTPDEWLGVNNLRIGNFGTTAASVSVSGRVLTPGGRGIARASITMWDDQGNARNSISNPFGFYSFDDVPAGRTYIFTIASRRYIFNQPSQVLNVDNAYDSLNFFTSSK
ncbi:MAG: carboxypeptidase-like regulatory domain-containing protein [Pyrinomonadaceae bacterium]